MKGIFKTTTLSFIDKQSHFRFTSQRHVKESSFINAQRRMNNIIRNGVRWNQLVASLLRQQHVLQHSRNTLQVCQGHFSATCSIHFVQKHQIRQPKPQILQFFTFQREKNKQQQKLTGTMGSPPFSASSCSARRARKLPAGSTRARRDSNCNT